MIPNPTLAQPILNVTNQPSLPASRRNVQSRLDQYVKTKNSTLPGQPIQRANQEYHPRQLQAAISVLANSAESSKPGFLGSMGGITITKVPIAKMPAPFQNMRKSVLNNISNFGRSQDPNQIIKYEQPIHFKGTNPFQIKTAASDIVPKPNNNYSQQMPVTFVGQKSNNNYSHNKHLDLKLELRKNHSSGKNQPPVSDVGPRLNQSYAQKQQPVSELRKTPNNYSSQNMTLRQKSLVSGVETRSNNNTAQKQHQASEIKQTPNNNSSQNQTPVSDIGPRSKSNYARNQQLASYFRHLPNNNSSQSKTLHHKTPISDIGPRSNNYGQKQHQALDLRQTPNNNFPQNKTPVSDVGPRPNNNYAQKQHLSSNLRQVQSKDSTQHKNPVSNVGVRSNNSLIHNKTPESELRGKSNQCYPQSKPPVAGVGPTMYNGPDLNKHLVTVLNPRYYPFENNEPVSGTKSNYGAVQQQFVVLQTLNNTPNNTAFSVTNLGLSKSIVTAPQQNVNLVSKPVPINKAFSVTNLALSKSIVMAPQQNVNLVSNPAPNNVPKAVANININSKGVETLRPSPSGMKSKSPAVKSQVSYTISPFSSTQNQASIEINKEKLKPVQIKSIGDVQAHKQASLNLTEKRRPAHNQQSGPSLKCKCCEYDAKDPNDLNMHTLYNHLQYMVSGNRKIAASTLIQRMDN